MPSSLIVQWRPGSRSATGPGPCWLRWWIRLTFSNSSSWTATHTGSIFLASRLDGYHSSPWCSPTTTGRVKTLACVEISECCKETSLVKNGWLSRTSMSPILPRALRSCSTAITTFSKRLSPSLFIDTIESKLGQKWRGRRWNRWETSRSWKTRRTRGKSSPWPRSGIASSSSAVAGCMAAGLMISWWKLATFSTQRLGSGLRRHSHRALAKVNTGTQAVPLIRLPLSLEAAQGVIVMPLTPCEESSRCSNSKIKLTQLGFL